MAGCYGATFDNGFNNVLSTWIGQITNTQTGSAPTASFSGNPTQLVPGGQVIFSDQSSQQPANWSWSFPGGDPFTSTQQNPIVTYNTPGTYDVLLTVTNGFGTDTEIKSGYITVTEESSLPIADFTSDVQSVHSGGFVQYEDLSLNEPTAWHWFFEGGIPDESFEQHPLIIYPQAGCFNVGLIVSNAAGENSLIRSCYIDVATATNEIPGPFTSFVTYPNPVTSGTLNVAFEIDKATELNFTFVDESGSVVKHLLHRLIKAGLNTISFQTDQLPSGAYFLVIHGAENQILRSEKIIVAH